MAEYEHLLDDDDELIDDLEQVSRAEEARRNAIEWTVVLVGAVLLALVLRAVVLQAFWIPSPSMEETLLIRDRVLVNKLSYRFGDIERGEIIVFHRTDEEIALDPDQPREVIKRVIAFGGETIEIRDNVVYINSEAIDEPYLAPGALTTDYEAEVVPEGHLFVLGDNREVSLDSRFDLGPVAEDRVVGRAFVVFWPLNRIAWL
jgi:signal peptidase I